MADDISAYGKGYRAGRKRLEADDMRGIERIMREDFIQRMMISIAPQVISSPWRKKKADGTFQPDRSAEQIMETVREIAVEAANTCFFEAPPIQKDTPQ